MHFAAFLCYYTCAISQEKLLMAKSWGDPAASCRGIRISMVTYISCKVVCFEDKCSWQVCVKCS